MDAGQFYLLRYEPVHRAMPARLLGELTDVQIRSRPAAVVNPIAWIVWHMARGEDLGVSRFVGHRPQLFFEDAWGPRLNAPDADLGTGMTAEEVAELSARIDLDGLRAYWAELPERQRGLPLLPRATGMDRLLPAPLRPGRTEIPGGT